MLGTYLHSFALPNGRKVFVPSSDGRESGAEIQSILRKRWRPPPYFYHLQKGGHVAALRHHLPDAVFCTLDISGFFDSITRSKAHRALREIGFDHERAWEITCTSAVEKTKGRRDFSLPYGFIQSPILASLALDKSGLGRAMRKVVRSNQTRLSCYVDDIIVSGLEQESVEQARANLIVAARLSHFEFNLGKSQPPAGSVQVFNVVLSQGAMRVSNERMMDFEAGVRNGSEFVASGIISYVCSINREQARALEATRKLSLG